jgi:elongation factor G
VFKTLSEPHVGDVSVFRVLSGAARNGDEVYNATRDATEKLNHLAIAQGRERIEVAALHAGDIGCVAKLRDTHTNDTLSTRAHPVRLPGIGLPEPLVQMAIHATNRADEEKLQLGLHRLHEEDPSLDLQFNPETRETLVTGSGERHLEVALAKLKRKFGVVAELRKPKIAYRETIRLRAEGQGRHKKQSGGRGQFGDCWVRIAPAQRGDGIRFEDHIVGGAIPSKFIPAVEKGIHEAAERGVLAGFPLVDFQVELFDGSYHTVDSNEMSFKMAGIQAFKAVAPRCKPVLLEPLDELEIVAPEDSLGDVLGDLSARRGQILGTDTVQDLAGTRIRAVVPQSELYLYASALQSMTHGRAVFHRHFRGYEEMPSEAAQRVVEEAAKEQSAAQTH